ncbi:hypothetical protein DSM106972_041130 [Dulcicalothrix desertica PCC 7102]|uniref:Uncharacterized protein n=1 Tax=Dulcicalothrix desertica PCC 7102 TaxID=232991 RepID=A0A3S1ANC1_9CYAN|nr:hypothetical protein DSM106972_041130 [Dulcicalothrix desertica PCC 7102]
MELGFGLDLGILYCWFDISPEDELEDLLKSKLKPGLSIRSFFGIKALTESIFPKGVFADNLEESMIRLLSNFQ